MSGGYHHDHDEELGMYWYGDESPTKGESACQVSNAVPVSITASSKTSQRAPSQTDSTLIRLGECIRDLRMAKEWTRDDLASRCGLDRSFIEELEAGRANPTHLHL